MSAWFVAGSGTDVGKTWVSCGLLRAWRGAGLAAHAVKPLASGLAPPDDPAFADSDPARLIVAQGQAVDARSIEACTPWRFAAPLAPDMAAAAEGRAVDFEAVAAWTRAVVDAGPPAGRLLVEGVGGLMSPLAEHATNLDLARALDLPVLLVCGSYLGAIGHGLAALVVLKGAGLRAAALVVNESPAPDVGAPVDLAATAASFARFAGETPVRVLRRGEAATPAALGLP